MEDSNNIEDSENMINYNKDGDNKLNVINEFLKNSCYYFKSFDLINLHDISYIGNTSDCLINLYNSLDVKLNNTNKKLLIIINNLEKIISLVLTFNKFKDNVTLKIIKKNNILSYAKQNEIFDLIDKLSKQYDIIIDKLYSYILYIQEDNNYIELDISNNFVKLDTLTDFLKIKLIYSNIL